MVTNTNSYIHLINPDVCPHLHLTPLCPEQGNPVPKSSISVNIHGFGLFCTKTMISSNDSTQGGANQQAAHVK